MNKISIAVLAVVVLVAGGLFASSLFGTQSSTTSSTQSVEQSSADDVRNDVPSSSTSTTEDSSQDPVVTNDVETTEDVVASTCGCEGGQFAANVSVGAQCAANRFCQSPVDCQSWDSYAVDQLGAGPWPSGSTIKPDESCGVGCQWTLSCSR